MNRDDIFTEKVKNDNETSNGHKTALECPISANEHFSESLRKCACVRATMPDSKIQNRQKTKGRPSKLELKFPIKIFISIIQSK